MSSCDNHSCHSTGGSVCQTLDELDFERGIWYAAQYGDLERIRKLLLQGINVNSKDKAGYTALHYASRAGHLDVCKYLLSKGADIDAITKCGEATSLHRAASVGKYEIVKFLIDNKADVRRKDADGKTILHRATESQNEKIIKLVIDTCFELKNEKDLKDKTALDYIQNDNLKKLFE